MLIDVFAPKPDAAESHAVEIAAPPEIVYRALRTTDFAESWAIRSLLAIRSLPRLVARRKRTRMRAQALTLDTLLGGGFGLLAEDAGREMVFGIEGQFSRPIENTQPFQEQNFSGPVRPGFARAIWNFAIVKRDGARTILSTDTRVMCGDQASRRKFRAYWLIVRPFSGLIRIVMLRAVRKACRQRRCVR